jgi:hypothetical protein
MSVTNLKNKEKTIRDYRPRRLNKDEPIVFFHKWEDGYVNYQGIVIELTKAYSGKVMFFDWIMGYSDGNQHCVTASYFDDCTFYDSDYDMNNAYAKSKKRPQKDSLA